VTKVQVSEEAQDDLEVAWENLEVARVIFETYKDQVRTAQCVVGRDERL
jgi:hypothetical protein